MSLPDRYVDDIDLGEMPFRPMGMTELLKQAPEQIQAIYEARAKWDYGKNHMHLIAGTDREDGIRFYWWLQGVIALKNLLEQTKQGLQQQEMEKTKCQTPKKSKRT